MSNFIAISFMSKELFKNVAKILDRCALLIAIVTKITKSETEFPCSTNTGTSISTSVTISSTVDIDTKLHILQHAL